MVVEGFVEHLIATFSYIGVFIANLIVSSSVGIPLPGPLIIIFAVATKMNIILVAIASGAGSIIGEMTGYYAGFLGNKVAKRTIRKYKKVEIWIKKFFNKYAIPVIFLAAFLPFPFDLVGIVAGSSRYSIPKFLLVGFLGKILKTIYLFLAIKYSWGAILKISGF